MKTNVQNLLKDNIKTQERGESCCSGVFIRGVGIQDLVEYL